MEIAFSRRGARIWRGILDMVTPSLCLGCGSTVGDPASLCLGCWTKLQHLDEPVCEALGTPLAYDQGEGALSAAALSDPPAWDRARAAVIFDDDSAKLVHALKYQDRPEAALFMARLMARAGRRLLAEADVMLPVPLHRLRLWRRRFNQSAVLAQRISALSGQPWRHDVLVRARRTRAQVGLDHEQRRKNVKAAFRVAAEKEAAVSGRGVLLIDDVRTTGATAEACAMALKAAGAAHVSLLTFALVPHPARPHI